MGDKWDAFWKRKQHVQTFTTKVPADVVKGLEKDYYTKQILRENAQDKVEIIKLKKQIKEKDIKKQQEKEEKKLEKDVWNHRILEKKLEKENSVMFKLVGPKKSPIIFTKSNKPYGNFVGFYVKQQSDGMTLWYPMVKIGMELRKINCVSINPLEFFNSVANIPGQLRAGKFDTSIDITKDGKPVIVRNSDFIDKIIKSESPEKLKVFHMDELERREYQSQLIEKDQYIRQLSSQVRQLKENEVEYGQELNDGELEASALERARDLASARITGIMDKNQAMVVETAKAVTAVQDAVLSQVMTEQFAKKILENWDEHTSKLASRYGKDALELAREEIKKVLSEGIAIRKGAEGAKQVVLANAPTEQAVKKAVEKEHG